MIEKKRDVDWLILRDIIWSDGPSFPECIHILSLSTQPQIKIHLSDARLHSKKKSNKRRVVHLICLSSVNYSAKSIHQRYHQVNINTNKTFQKTSMYYVKDIVPRPWDHDTMIMWIWDTKETMASKLYDHTTLIIGENFQHGLWSWHLESIIGNNRN